MNNLYSSKADKQDISFHLQKNIHLSKQNTLFKNML